MNKSLRKLEIRTLTIAVIVIIAMMGSFLTLFVGKTNEFIKKNLADMMAANGQQLKINVNHYLNSVENASRLMFGEEDYVSFNAADPTLSDYDRIQKEEEISTYIGNLGLAENFADFGIIYENDKKVGLISQTTAARYADGGIYEHYRNLITDAVEEKGWSSEAGDRLDRLVFVKRLNDHAIILASFYSDELTSLFGFTRQLNGVTACLTDENNKVLYSTDKAMMGKSLTEEILSPLHSEDKDAVGVNSDYFSAINTLDNDWKVYCYAPVELLMEESLKDTQSLLVISAVLAAVFLAVFVLLSKIIAAPMNGIVDSLEARAESDGLTGVYNKVTFERAAEELCKGAPKSGFVVMLMLDVDKFKEVNDKYGHARGDEVLAENARAMKRYMEGASAIGRVGGDEFAACYTFAGGTFGDVHQIVSREVEEYRTAFHECMMAKKIDVTTSVGVVISSVVGEDFGYYYLNADRALYESKRSGRNRVTWFNEDSEGIKMMQTS